MKQITDLLPRQVHGQKDEVIGGFLAKLHDVFAQVGFNDFKTLFSQRVIQMNFLRRHAFGFDDGTDLVLPRNTDDVIPRLLRAGRPKDLGAARFEPGDEFIEVTVQMIDGLPFGFSGQVARARPVLKAVFVFVAFGVVSGERLLNQVAMAQVHRIAARRFVEFPGVNVHVCASTSARCNVLMDLPCRSSTPRICIRQLESLEMT